MSSSHTLGGTSRPGRILGPSLDKIIKNVAWRKHAHLVSACKSALDKLETLTDSPDPNPNSPIFGYSLADAESFLQPLILAIDSASVKVVDPALECVFKLLSQGLIRGEIDRPEGSESQSIGFRVIDSICKCGGLTDDGIELAVLKVLISAIRSPFVLIRGDCLVNIAKTCYNVYLSSLSVTNQICAKAVLAQIVMIVFARVEEDTMDVKVKAVSVSELLELSDKSLSDGSLVQFVQSFINEVMEGRELQNGGGAVSDAIGESGGNGQLNEGGESGADSKIREDGVLLFKNLCKFSMKFSTQENPEDPLLIRGKVLSLELLKVLMENGGPIWRTNERQVFLC
ncbi:hypothetical protein BVC80_9085g106 [Macleaya cordata]|uniref:Uncharacterized protein n=1 Tax=Macleaya cordata TaxID=56857 RepID=A0A200PR69_MACCD|nr:hypothetical protein BVC80_9085g106 [Macleaya cordata]